MRTNIVSRKPTQPPAEWSYYNDEGQSPIQRFLHKDNPENVYPNRRIIAFLFLGAALSVVGVQFTADEYYVGPHADISKTGEIFPNSRFPVHIAFQDVGCYIPSRPEPILQHVTGEIKPGRLTGILGQSGSGKTTFAYALLGRGRRYCQPNIGNVFLNGRPRNLEAFLDRVGYVPQDDVLYSELTVEESLLFSANWRLPRSVTEDQKLDLLEETLRILDLEHIRDQRIGDVQERGISGGEKKRVSIGMELIAQPSVLVMDEPTSGLDSNAAYRLVQTLRFIAEKGVSVVAVLHQPSTRVYELLHDVILMQRGQLAYIGDRDEALPFLKGVGYDVPMDGQDQCRHPPAEYLLDALAGIELPRELMKNRTRPSNEFAPLPQEQDERETTCPAALRDQMVSDAGWSLPAAFRAYQAEHNHWDAVERHMEHAKIEEDKILNTVFRFNETDEDKDGGLVDLEKVVHKVTGFLHRCVCSSKKTSYLCTMLGQQETGVHPYYQLPKPGLKRQLGLWFFQMNQLTFRRGMLTEFVVISLLASVVALVRSYNIPWNRRSIANFLLSIAIGLVGMVGAVFNDNIGPVQRAAASGMLLGAHEFALLAHIIFKGWLTSHIFGLVYFGVLWTRTGIWCCVSQNRVDYARFHTYYEFCHMLHLNYMASSSLGSVICVVSGHRLSTSYIVAVATLMSSHVFAFFTPNKNQVERDSRVFEGTFGEGVNISPIVETLCQVSYARYFMEAIMLWEPDKFYDKNGRRYALKYFGYAEANKTWCCTNLFTLWTINQATRFIVFGFLNTNDFHTLYDTPLLFTFIFKVICCHFLALVLMTIIQEWYFPWIANIQRTWGWKSPTYDFPVDVVN